jgi:hypothetical protein
MNMIDKTSSYLSLDDIVMIRVLPQFDVDKPSIFEKLDALRRRPLHASIKSHHDEVEARLISCAPVSGRIRP